MSAPSIASRHELDSLISSLVGDGKSRPVSSRSSSSTHAPAPNADRLPAAVGPNFPKGTNENRPDVPSKPLSFAPLRTVYEIRSDHPKTEVVTYSKGVQTSQAWSTDLQTSPVDSDYGVFPMGERAPRRSLSRRRREREEQIRQNIRTEVEEELKELHNLGIDDTERQKQQKHHDLPVRNLTGVELDAVTSSSDFLDFIDKSSKVVERALEEEYNVLADYRLGLNGGDEEDGEYGAHGRKGTRIRQVIQFYDERWSKKRMITDVGFSPKFPELVLSSYTKNPSAPYDPDGLVQIWNLHMRDRPEYVFQASSDVLTAMFSPFHPNIVLGGTYTGQVLLWDTRVRSPHPVQRTPLTGYGHSHPIYSLNIVGTQNAHNIVSTSTDGTLCTWSVDMLSHPAEHLVLSAPRPASHLTNPYSRPDEIAPTCTTFPATDPSYLLAGTEQGTIHLCHRHERAGAKSGVDPRVAYTGHTAPVMSVDFHRAVGPVDLGDLLLSSSLDWSVKIWRIAAPTPTAAANTNTSPRTLVRPLLDLPHDDAVYDARWSPVKPGVFACVDGAGVLEVWDLHRDTESPAARAVPTARVAEARKGAALPAPARALNSCAWEGREGRKVAVGGLDGVVSVFEVGGELGGVGSASAEEWVAVRRRLR